MRGHRAVRCGPYTTEVADWNGSVAIAFRGRCSSTCGWRGPVRGSRDLARADWIIHKRGDAGGGADGRTT